METDQLEQAIEKIGVLPLKRWCQITGETANAVHQRIYKKTWKEGVHVFKPEGYTGWWVKLDAVGDWVYGTTPIELVASFVRSEQQAPAAP